MNSSQAKQRNWVVGITGASGAIYGVKFCQALLERGFSIHLVITDAGWRVLHEELNWSASKRMDSLASAFGDYPGTYTYHPVQDIGASIASGSFRVEGMVIIPCSMGTLARVAHGLSDNLMERTADVMLKEKRKLIMLPRETPLHTIHLENMLKLSQMGVSMVPAMPAFYYKPETLDDMVDFLIGKVMDLMQLDNQMFRRWGEENEQ
ncbi:UbiX family flavin prenyltransferase [Longirhabdus pacifica]|uniref:UbiX family flavin prenyltransferase n=1 Tax=Longirhabdus pacifica TaxID=2305227 RepID=UPI00100927D3|nr:UbiX family flavin prenyltransferase [Longirhabdus pacifica]